MHYFRSIGLLQVVILIVVGLLSCSKKGDIRILIFSKTAVYSGKTSMYRHESIETGVAAVKKICTENGYSVEATEDASYFNEENLQKYSAVIFLNTTGNVLDHYQQADFERYIQAGGGFVGIHSAADTEHDWKWFHELVGGTFQNHPAICKADLKVKDKSHPSTSMLPDTWERTDEWYNYKSFYSGIKPLLHLDESSYEGGTHGNDHPIAWFHEYDGGRAFYTGGGHTKASFSEPLFLQHLLGGIRYAIGKNQLDYSNVSNKRVPKENRFAKTVLAQNLEEPMELDVFDDGSILFIERKGNLMLFDPKADSLKTITKFPVYTKHEDGLLGLAIDPEYHENKWIYLFYSPIGKEAVQHVSRFVFDKDSLYYDTEKILLKIPVQRDECCHSAGALEFGPDGNLFISVGDDTNPFASDGFAPIDERKGRSAWDAQKSSANTNDLRGKILRIKPRPDGTYTIPEGNLFPEGTPKTRPEIYVMGCRNPFRFDIDNKTKYLYWGDVGPDAGKDGDHRGPKGIDEINQARGPGFWGWPYFRGKDMVYYDYDFSTEASGPLFNPQNPLNDSPNNTGLEVLPPFQPSIIWYSYDKSEAFPWIGVGGKNPMAGPVYYADEYKGKNKFPDYFDGKLFIYEWMRHWIYVVKFDSMGMIEKIDPFMQEEEFSRPMDMVFGRDGKLYLLEYGNQWYARNLDARLSRIDYITGNRSPVANIKANKTIGSAPLTVIFSAEDSYDLDEDKLRYEWKFTGDQVQDRTAYPRFTFEKPGIYQVQLKVRDPSGESSTAKLEIQVGNEPPEVRWELAGNHTFYWDNRNIRYKVNVEDYEDGNLESGIDPADIQVTFDYLPEGYDITAVAQGHQTADQTAAKPRGLQLIESSDCKSCHAQDKKINGPSYQQIASRYQKDDLAVSKLSKRVLEGSSGNWGTTAMVAHPQLTKDQATEIVLYILSLGSRKQIQSDHPPSGEYMMNAHRGDEKKGRYLLMASYTDNGNGNIKPITQQEQLYLRYHRINAEEHDEGPLGTEFGDGVLREIFHDDYLVYNNIDLTDINEITLKCAFRADREIGGNIEIRLDSVDGMRLGEANFTSSGEKSIIISPTKNIHNIYLVFKSTGDRNKQIVMLDWIEFRSEKVRL